MLRLPSLTISKKMFRVTPTTGNSERYGNGTGEEGRSEGSSGQKKMEVEMGEEKEGKAKRTGKGSFRSISLSRCFNRDGSIFRIPWETDLLRNSTINAKC